MVVAICEVVDVVPCNRVYSVVKSSLLGSLASPCKVSLESWSSGVEVAHGISVVSPAFPKNLLKCIRELFKGRSLTSACRRNQIELLELLVGYLSAEDALDHISPIKTVHAIGPKASILSRYDVDVLGLEVASLQGASSFDLCDRVPIIFELFLHYLYKFRQVFPFHVLAFTMEVKPYVVQLRILQFLVNSRELVANALLRTFLVNQVYEVLRAVVSLRVFEMLLSHLS